MKAVNGFLVIQRQITFKVYNVRKLHRPRMFDGFLADSIDRYFASPRSCTTTAAFTELHDQLASLEKNIRIADALSLLLFVCHWLYSLVQASA